MARNELTPDAMDTMSEQLFEAAKSVAATAKLLRDGGMPHILVHGNMTTNSYLPSLLGWVDKLSGEAKTQLRAYQSGMQSKAELHKQQAEKQKTASAKKPSKPKRPKST